MSDLGRRVAINESIFREVNERIAELGDKLDLPSTEYVCECADQTCTQGVRLSVREYEAVRAKPKRFFVCRGHEQPQFERIVDENERFLVVEKAGEAGDVAAAADPRSH